MPNYKISGYVGEACDIRLMRGNTFIGHKSSVPAGAYELIFALDSIENVDVVAVKSDGNIVGYGGITPISTVGGVNITVPPTPQVDYIQAGSFSSASTSVDITINSVDTTKTIIRAYSREPYLSSYPSVNSWLPTVVNSTTVNFLRNSTPSNYYCHYEVIQFTNVKSLQKGIINYTTNPMYVNISSVNTSKSLVIIGGFRHSDNYQSPVVAWFSSSTQLTFSGKFSAARYDAWNVIEFN